MVRVIGGETAVNFFPKCHRLDCRSSTKSNKPTSHLPMLKMHKWQGEVPTMAMHYALCNFDYELTGRTPFPPKPYAFSPYVLSQFRLYLHNQNSLASGSHPARRCISFFSTSGNYYMPPTCGSIHPSVSAGTGTGAVDHSQ